MTKPIKLAIFDLDGVIANTSIQHFQAWKKLFYIVFGLDVEAFLESKTKGVSRMDSLIVLLEHYGINPKNININRLTSMKNDIYLQLIEKICSEHVEEGVLRTFEFLRASGIKIALGSASRNGPMILNRLGIFEYFDYIVDPTKLKGKPNPDIFLNAKCHFGCDSDECIAFEDSLAGIESIKRSNMFAIGIGDVILEQADVHFDSMSVLPNDILRRIIEGSYEK